MLRHQCLQNIPQIFSVISQCIDVLRNTVMTPDQGFSIKTETTVNSANMPKSAAKISEQFQKQAPEVPALEMAPAEAAGQYRLQDPS